MNEDDFPSEAWEILQGAFMEVDQRIAAKDQGQVICEADHEQLLVFGVCPMCRAAL